MDLPSVEGGGVASPEAVKRNGTNITVLAIGMMLVFTGFNTMQSLVPSLSSHGLVALAIIYAVFSVLTLVAAYPVQVFGLRLSIVVSCAVYAAWTANTIALTTLLLYLASFLVGVFAAMLWTAQGAYVTACSTQETLGKSNGRFWGIFFAQGVLGNLIATVMLQSLPASQQHVVFPRVAMVMSGLAALGVLLLLLLLRKPMSMTGEADDSEVVEKPDVLATFRLLTRNRHMRWVIPIFVYHGLGQSFLFGGYPAYIGAKFTPPVMLTLGIVQVVASPVLGQLSDRFGRRVAFLASGFFALAAYVLAPMSSSKQPWLFFVAMSLLGISDSGFYTQISSVLGTLFPENTPAAFAAYRFVQSVLTAAAMWYSDRLPFPLVALAAAVALLIGISSIVYLSVLTPLDQTVDTSTSAKHNASTASLDSRISSDIQYTPILTADPDAVN